MLSSYVTGAAGGGAGTNYRGPAVRKGARGKTMLHIKVFLFTNECTSDCLKNNIKIYIKTAPTCFGAGTSS